MAHMNTSWRNHAVALIATAALGGAMAVGTVAPTPAWAVPATVTIEQKANPDAKYQAFQLFKADVADDASATNVTWGTNIDDVKQTAIAAQLDALTENGYTAWLTAKDLTSETDKTNPQNALDFITETITKEGAGEGAVVDATDFAMKFAKWLQTENLIAADTATAGQPFTSEEGYYLFVTDPKSLANGDVATAPIWFPLGCSTTKITEKAKAPTVDKEVSGNQEGGDIAIGDTLPFVITATLPSNFGSFDTYKMVLTDTPSHLAIKEGVIVKADGTDITKAEGVTVDLGDNGSSLIVTINDLKKAYPKATANTKVTVEYTAELLPDASTTPGENQNNVKYEFSNDPNSNGTGTTTDKPVIVYTFLLDLLKVDEKTNEALEGAGFTICNDGGEYYDQNTHTWSLSKEDAEKNLIVTSKEGKLEIKGMPTGTYTLTEVKAPEGYEAQEGSSLTFTVNAEYDENGQIVEGSFKVDDIQGSLAKDFVTDGSHGTISVTAKNNKQISLAMTGAEGVGLAGVGVLGLGMAWYLVNKRRKDSEQA